MSVAAYVKSLDKDLIVTGFKRACFNPNNLLIKTPFKNNEREFFIKE
jgi:hypothetical protein